MNEEPLSQIHTACRDCVFAQYKENTQVGCKLDKINDYKNAEIPIVEAHDGNKEFYVINGRVCLSFRNEEVLKDYPVNSWEEIVKLQTKVPYQIICFIEEDDKLIDLKNFIKSIKRQEVQPNRVTFINKQYSNYINKTKPALDPKTILEVIQDNNFHQYQLRNAYDLEVTNRDWIDMVFDNTKDLPIPFYFTFDCNKEIPDNFTKEFNDAICIKMLQIGVAIPNEGLHGYIGNKIAHKKHAGNSFGILLEDKILELEENGDRFIFKVENICPSIK